MNKIIKAFTIPEIVFFLVFFFGIMGGVATFRPISHGDVVEYVLMTEALTRFRSLEYTESLLSAYVSEKPDSLGVEGFNAIKGKDGKFYLVAHPFYYSAFVVPMFFIFGLIDRQFAYRSFYVSNLLWFSIAMVCMMMYAKKAGFKSYTLSVVGSFLLLATVYPYIYWASPEIFIFSLVTIGLYFIFATFNPYLASLMLGVASGQSLILIFMFLNILVAIYQTKERVLSKSIICGIIFVICLAGPSISTYLSLGKLFGLTPYIHISYQAVFDFVRAIIDPAVGLVWFYPLSCLILFGYRNTRKNAVMVVTIFLSLLFSMFNRQFYAHQVGLRYLLYIYPGFFYLLRPKIFGRHGTYALFVCAAFLTWGINTDVTVNNHQYDISVKNFVPYRIVNYLFPFIYPEHPEVFISHALSIDPEANEDSQRIYIDFSDRRMFYDDRWLGAEIYIKILVFGLKSGKLTFTFVRDEDVLSKAIFNGKVYETRGGVLTIPVAARDIVNNDKMRPYSYIYLWFNRCPCDAVDKLHRTLGNRLVMVENNTDILYRYTLDK